MSKLTLRSFNPFFGSALSPKRGGDYMYFTAPHQEEPDCGEATRLRRFCVCPVSAGSPAKLGCLLYSFRWPVCLSLFNLISFISFLSLKKEQKRPAHAKISHNSLLLTSRKRHPSFACCLAQTAFRSTIGDKRTRFSRNNSNRMNTAQTAFVLFRCLNGCLL